MVLQVWFTLPVLRIPAKLKQNLPLHHYFFLPFSFHVVSFSSYWPDFLQELCRK